MGPEGGAHLAPIAERSGQSAGSAWLGCHLGKEQHL